jgi:hypothetical protein
MPFVYALLIFFGILLYLAYLACAVPIGAIAAFAVYSVGMPVAYFIGLERVLVRRAPSLPGPARRRKTPADADPAVLQYFYGPALDDADHAVRIAYRECRRLRQRGSRIVASAFSGNVAIVTGPLGVGGAVGMAAGTVVGAVATVGCACVHLLAVGISAAAVRAAGTALRAADSVVLRVKNIRMVCPACYKRVSYPGYECPGDRCTRRHRDIRPGRFGVLRRRCRCGAQMKTLLLFGSAGMNAHCPRCDHSLEHRPGHAPELVLPFFGAAGAGKTRLLFSVVTELQQWSRKQEPEAVRHRKRRWDRHEKRFAVEFGDSATTRKLENADKLLSPKIDTDKTPPGLPRAYVIRLVSKRRTRILQMFDAAGELFYTSERIQELGYLDKARTFILVIDPLSVEAFWDRLLPDQQAELKAVRSDAPSPELAYQQAHQEIESMGVRLRKARLAVVFSRADLISAPAEDVAVWARDELGLGNLVRSARLNFGEACFFHTAAVMTGGVIDDSVPALLRWVLACNGINLPEGLS